MIQNSKRQSGLTLIEILIAITVIAILLSIAVPNFRTAIQNNRVATQGNELVTAFQLARSEALKRRAPVIVCASANGTSCGGAWNAGWIVAEDSGQPGTTNFVPVADGPIRVWTGLRGGMTLASVDANDAAVAAVRFLPRGTADQVDRAFPYVFSLAIPDCQGDQARDITIARSGSVISERVACN
ncbi:MAG: GspH/FimT family pseudopilin [Wenzhouxiangella sp.]